jgi:membrane-bound lytic murein transglycosylase F
MSAVLDAPGYGDAYPMLRVLRGRPVLRSLLALAVLLVGLSGFDPRTELERIQERGRLVVLTINGATTYYLGPNGESGFEYDLARAFADALDLPLEVVVLPAIEQLVPALQAHRGDLIAANLARSPDRLDELRFGPVYEQVEPVVVYRRGSRRPREPADLADGRLGILGGTSYASFLRPLADAHGVEWDVFPDASIEDLLEAVSNEELDFTILDSNILDLNRRYFPAVRPAFEIGPIQPLAWATRLGDDDSLAQAMREFFASETSASLIGGLRERYYSHVENYEPVGTFNFMQQMRERLPAIRSLFEQAAAETGLDWRLLAAVSYQESHWDPDAVSRTGVRGLMMLTLRTARQVGIEDRRDPEQSVFGGARYLVSLMERLPDRIEQPDRLWLALAAYNIGLGHLEDARVLTEAQGGDPDRWVDVRDRLPLLTQERFFSQTRFGYARGYEAFSYVENIRTFYEILVWMDGRDHPLLARSALEDDETPPIEPNG